MVKVSPIEAGLNPKKFETAPTLMEIGHNEAKDDCLTVNDRTSKDNKPYQDYTLHITGSDGEWAGDFKMNYLFDRDLKALVEAWGEDSVSWLGKRITIQAVKDGKYLRWKILPHIDKEQTQLTEEPVEEVVL